MALANGVLVHGPHAWACAIRRDDGTIKVASARKRLQASRVRNPLLRGPARLLEALALLPQVKRKMPAARMPMERPSVVGSMVGASRRRARAARVAAERSVARELLAGVVTMAPAVLALRGGDLASYHGAEHIAIGTYESGKPATKEHERCGGHLVGPLLVTSAIANTLAGLAPERSAARRRPSRRSARSPRRRNCSAGCRATRSAGSRALSRSRVTAPAPLLHRRADGGAARSRRGGARPCLKLERKATRAAAPTS